MTLKCIITDDEPSALKLLKRYVDDTPFLELVAMCSSAKEAMEALASHEIDLLFLDIHMPDLSGMALAKSIDPAIPIIFTTAFDQYAIEGYKVNAKGYLLKPFSYEEFIETVSKLTRAATAQSTTPPAEREYIMVKADYKTWQIPLNEIRYFEGVKDYVKIHRENESKPLMPLMSMKYLEEYLPPSRFMRVHRSFIVNLDKIRVIERHQILFDEVRITVSENYREAFQQFIKQRFGT
ncbi:LytR/AlgR family response regulator transcription factor [Marinoscillum furvescens]|uniref:LytTR family two component transcriptional regulator n=1 Tax=Marinoscillum furvescens DSM 4134 TaxID=1122208 RepID=A0A3D9KY18_MARFU|nr:LytTR family DNA-binding domain-containing protein [Marinoscillum furvescens]RED92199.1 LytTR family two component transcriptional regulator [Marinoscillum furvescens DSM 4134]